MDKPRPLSLSAYAIALQKALNFKGKWFSQNDTCSRGLNSNFQILENREKSLEGKEESIIYIYFISQQKSILDI